MNPTNNILKAPLQAIGVGQRWKRRSQKKPEKLSENLKMERGDNGSGQKVRSLRKTHNNNLYVQN